MLGWLIIVKPNDNPHGCALATWKTSASGIDWLLNLVAEGKAIQRKRGGYPNLFLAKAADIVPLIMDGPPRHRDPVVIGDDYISKGGWTRQFELHPAQVDACGPDELLSIEAWDQS